MVDAAVVVSSDVAAVSCSSAEDCRGGSHLGMAMAELGSGLKSSL